MDSTATSSKNSEAATINLKNLTRKYLDHYQRLVDLSVFTLSSFYQASARTYEEFGRQVTVLPHKEARMPFDKAKSATENWVLKHILIEALSSVLPLMEDCRTICALCDLKVSKNAEAAAFEAVIKDQRKEFVGKPIDERFGILKKNYGLESAVEEHVQSLIQITMALAKDGTLTTKETNGQPDMTLKIRSVTLALSPAEGIEKGESRQNLTRKVSDNVRKLKVGEKINLSTAEQFGSLITMSIFASSMIQGVETYARKTGAL